MSDTMFPKREERVPYGGGKPVRGGRSDRSGKGNEKRTDKRAEKRGGRREQPEPQKKRIRKGGRKPDRKVLYLIGIAAVLLIVFLMVRKNGSAVFLNEEQVGILKGRDITAEELTTTLESQLESIVGSKVKINEEIRVDGVHIGSRNEKDVCTMEHLLPKMRNMVTYKVDAAVITVDGGRAVVLASQALADSVLEQLKTELLPDGGIPEDAKVEWVENVQVVNEFVDSEEILSPEDATAVLKSTTEVTQSYTVQSGDALYLIAQEFKTTVEKLLELNPGEDLKKGIRVGQVINVPVQKPKISVKTIETQVLTAVEPKTYQTQYDDTKPSSYQKVIQQGKAGQKKSTIQITRINGVVTEEKEVSKEIIQEAIPEIIVKGTQ
ncbi:MAG: G5 domain-containing protein [Bacillota bacterium]|nr:G5 domain-containing protein [Bacillota bacterium]